jgi:hypothetical protein
MTIEEIENSYVFKVVRRALMNELPYIKEVRVSRESFNDTYTLIFMEFDFDPFIFSKLHNIPLSNMYLRSLNYRDEDSTSVPQIFFKKDYRDEVSSIMRGIDTLVKDIESSPAIPKEYKILNKKLTPYYYRALKEFIPQDMQQAALKKFED